MTQTLLVAGTASHVGKSTIVAGLCRALADRGVDVAPFKAQNMSNNARVAVRPDGEWGEIGVSQHVQARAARVPTTTDMNPVLLKPRGDGESQLVIDGEAVGHFSAGNYYDDHWEDARAAAESAYDRLASDHDVIVAEGAGSIAEINLHDRDLANLETIRFADADVLVLADIERGGAFAALYGTLALIPDEFADTVVGSALTKFRGDASLLDSGIDEIETRTGVPVVGVVPYDDPGLPAEDSVSLPAVGERGVIGGDSEVPEDETVTVAVPRLPRLSNATDLESLAGEPGVRVAYEPLDDDLADADAVVLPGTKNTVDDLRELRRAGFDSAIRSFTGPVVGLCGGYQMLGERIENAGVESTESVETVEGFGLLPVTTTFSPEKRVERVEQRLDGVGPLAGATGPVSGYEIHMGSTTPTEPVETPLSDESAATDRILGTYLHGLFENERARRAFRDAVFAHAGKRPPTVTDGSSSPFERAKTLVNDNLNTSFLDEYLRV
ncbi:cobyric acid synthase [Haloarchaeobius sp. DFWS5]|uniref:cobyric acid synthase n=1 Tax=Haloarchaeobius sp. DFWS5 TaxID=3446114 RepID=UPI003EB7BADD